MSNQNNFQSQAGVVQWCVHFHSSADTVYEYLSSADKRKLYWAESAEEQNGVIKYRFLNGIEDDGRILEKSPGRLFRVEYFGAEVTFEIEPCEPDGCDMSVTAKNVEEHERCELIAGWVSWLMAMKGAVDFGVDLRNHDPGRTWADGFADN